MPSDLTLRVRFAVDDRALTDLHARAFGHDDRTSAHHLTPWADRLDRHSLTWIGAYAGEDLVGFVHAVWDGGAHAFLLDTVVDPALRRRGLGQALVRALTEQVMAAGCEWLHVDYEPHLESFYTDACGFRPTRAGLIRLADSSD